MKIGIVGAGLAGLSAAYDLLGAGHEVTLFEASEQAGGLANGFKDDRWEWPLEKFYHHIFETDESLLALVEEIGIREKLFFPRPLSSVFYGGQLYPFDSPLRILKFPPLTLPRFVRFGAVTTLLRYARFWRYLEQHTADSWMRRWYGDAVYEASWRPLLINKFGPYYQEVNMAWMWARLVARSFRLGYFEGGFQTLVDGLVRAVEGRGGVVKLSTPVQQICAENGRLALQTPNQPSTHFDQVLVTTSPRLLSKLAPELPEDYLAQLLNLKSMGAVVLTLASKRPLMPDGETYWLNLPAVSPDKHKNELPFTALVEHTNYIDKKHYGGDHIVYCGDYVKPDHPYMTLEKDEIVRLFTADLHKVNPDFDASWIRDSWLYRVPYAQPVPLVNHSANIPDLQTPLPGLFFASMSQVYPWDRGTNFAVEIGRRVAKLMQL